MIDPPKRAGYRLTYDAELMYNDWQDVGGCTCFISPPCSSCTHEGHPISLEVDDEAWELDEEETEMSRSEITDKSNPPKSEWFGYKYRVTPETSKLLQEAVFKDGGKWAGRQTYPMYLEEPFIQVTHDGKMWRGSTNFEEIEEPEKQPPQMQLPKPAKVEQNKDFVAGKWYKCKSSSWDDGVFTVGKYYLVEDTKGNDCLCIDGKAGGWFKERFDVNSGLDYDPSTTQPAGYAAYVVFRLDVNAGSGYATKEYSYKCSRDDYMQWLDLVGLTFDGDVFAEVNVNGVEKTVKVVRIEAIADPKATKSIVRILPKELAIENKKSKIDDVVKVTINRDDFFTKETLEYPTTKEENIMSNQNRVVSVKFFDDDAGLKAEQSLVAEYQITTRVSDAMTVSKVLLTEDVAGDIAAHNEVRAATIDLHILKQTGNKVTLQPIEFEDLRVEVRQI